MDRRPLFINITCTKQEHSELSVSRMELGVTFKRFYRSVAFILFLSTLYCSFNRYINVTPIQSTETGLLSNVQLPSILICTKNQFDLQAAKEEGYPTFNLFYNGIIGNGSDDYEISWAGLKNRTYQELTNVVFKNHNEDLEFEDHVTVKDLFILPQGHCKRLIFNFTENGKNDPLKITIKNSSIASFEVFITDISKQMWFKIDETSFTGDKIDFDIEQDVKRHKFYEVKINEYNSYPSHCKEYEKIYEYAMCIAYTDESKIIPLLGCQPPWMTFMEHKQCKTPRRVNQKRYEALEFLKNINYVLAGLDYTSTACTNPCRAVTIDSRLYREFKSTKENRIYIYFNAMVEVTHNIPSFIESDLLVDIGSNLGLWIGFSVLDLLDFMTAGLGSISKVIK